MSDLRCPCGGGLGDHYDDESEAVMCDNPDCGSVFEKPALDGLRRMQEIVDEQLIIEAHEAYLVELNERRPSIKACYPHVDRDQERWRIEYKEHEERLAEARERQRKLLRETALAAKENDDAAH